MLGCFACPQALAGARNLTLGECQVGLGYEANPNAGYEDPRATDLIMCKTRSSDAASYPEALLIHDTGAGPILLVWTGT